MGSSAFKLKDSKPATNPVERTLGRRRASCKPTRRVEEPQGKEVPAVLCREAHVDWSRYRCALQTTGLLL